MTPPILEFFDDEPMITPAKMHAQQDSKKCHKIKTALCTFLSENIDEQLLRPILDECELVDYVFGRSGKVPIYKYRQQCLIVLLTVGSPVAVGVVEELKFRGVENLVVFGTAGKLDSALPDDGVVLIEKAIRDEGASYHYLAPSVYVATDTALTNLIEKMIQTRAKVTRGISWSTDAMFRETGKRLAARRKQGAVVVEMECAGFAAACLRLGIRFCEFVFFSDTLTDPRQWAWVGDTRQQDVRRSMKAEWLKMLLSMVDKIKLPKL